MKKVLIALLVLTLIVGCDLYVWADRLPIFIWAAHVHVGKPVVVRFNPNDSSFNDLVLDSWTYTDDLPTSLKI
jgi:hypothetical protein